MNRLLTIAWLAASVAVAGESHAEKRAAGLRGMGPRVGFTLDPEQLHVGGHLDIGDVTNNLALLPSFEMGFGDNLRIITIMADFNYRLGRFTSGWGLYAGGGIGPVFVSFDGGGDATDIGLTGQVGISRRREGGNTIFFETKLGLVDTPDLKLTVGWTFGS